MGTRAKTKKVKDAGEARQDVLRKVAASKELSFAEKGKLYHWDRPVCQGDRVNSKDSPNCLCALIPPPNGVRKQGLWCKTPEAVSALGEDPTFRKRVSHDDPIGLTNLGATCYVNAILQCLYMNADFRKGLFCTEEQLLEGNPVLRQLCRLFVKLQLSNEDPVDPAVFAKTLQLDNGVQQDGQEFMKLLLTLLEKLLEQSAQPDVRNLVQGLFRGTFSYVTRCSVCGNESDSSKNLVDFYELEVNVKGFEGLATSLDDYLGEELLEGDNQYMCERCNARVDATRSVKLRSLPPLLNFQLKRFVFNNKTATKKKVTSRFSFPISIDLHSRLTPEPQAPSSSEPEWVADGSSEGLYDLAAILVHKGAMATSGHYIAHVKDERTGDWWQFDDELVTSLGAHPLGEAAANASAKAAKEAKENGQKPEEKEGGGENEKDAKGEESVGPSKAEGVAAAEVLDPNLLTSADSYMLMYRRRDARQVAIMQRQEERRRRKAEADAKKLEEERIRADAAGKETKRKSEGEGREKVPKRARTGKAAKDEVAGTSAEKAISLDSPAQGSREGVHTNGVGEAGNGGKSQNGVHGSELLDEVETIEAPEALVREVENDNVAFDAAIEAYKSERERIEAEVNQRRREVREILAEAAADPKEYDFRWISTEWLRSWADNKDPPGPIDNTPLLCEHEGVPPRSVPLMKRINKVTWAELDERYGGGPELTGEECCVECIRQDASAAQSADSFRTRRTLMRERLEQELALGAPGTHYVSKQWLAQWQRRRLVDAPSDADKGPTAALRCKHEMLKPEFAPGAKRQLVSGEFWDYVQEVAEEVAGTNDPGHWEMTVNTLECATCSVELGEEMSNREGLKSGKLAEKAALEALFAGRPLPLTESVNAFLVPSKWLDSWRDYLGATGKTLDVIGEPPPLDEALAAVFCKHGELAVRPPELVQRKNDLVQEQKDSALTVVSENDWRQLQQRWHSSREITAVVGPPEPKSEVPKESDTKEAAKPACVPRLKTVPEVCEACYKERLDQELAERLSYRQQEIIVELFPGPDPPAHVTGAGGEGERRSRRVRKVSAVRGGRMTVKVNADTTVKDLKMTIWERMEVDSQNQRLGFLKSELDEDDKILADYGIVANSRLWLINTGEHDNRDIVECFEPAEEAGKMENGFRGTGLWGGATSDYSAGEGVQDTDMKDADGSGSADGDGSSEARQLPDKAADDVMGTVSEGEASGRWSCERCTLENSPGRKMCSVCNADRS